MRIHSLDDPPRKYGVILADPPWNFQTWGKHTGTRHADVHYPVMRIEDITRLPVEHLAADDCLLFLWVVDWLPLGVVDNVITSWGFTYKTKAFTWVKTGKTVDFPMGMGYWTRANPEDCLLATRGRPQRLDKGVPKLLLAPRREHSRKPDEVYDLIQRLAGGPYIELFARHEREGWDRWGDDA